MQRVALHLANARSAVSAASLVEFAISSIVLLLLMMGLLDLSRAFYYREPPGRGA